MKSWLRQDDGSWVKTDEPLVTKTGKVLTEADVEALAQDAERASPPAGQTLIIRGSFTEDELRRIVAVVADIEATRPHETFQVLCNEPDGEMDTMLARLESLPLRPNYRRVIEGWST